MPQIRCFAFAVACLLASCGGGGDPAPPAARITLEEVAVGQVREVPQEDMRVELRDVTDARCGAAQLCISSGFATAQLAIRFGAGEAQLLMVTLGKGDEDQQAILKGYRFTLDSLMPYPINAPWPKAQYRAAVSIQKL